jgi:hypothetical protein
VLPLGFGCGCTYTASSGGCASGVGVGVGIGGVFGVVFLGVAVLGHRFLGAAFAGVPGVENAGACRMLVGSFCSGENGMYSSRGTSGCVGCW